MYLPQISKIDSSPIQISKTDHVEYLLNQTLPMFLPTKNTSPSDILHIIKKLHNNKAPGHDLISNSIIKSYLKNL